MSSPSNKRISLGEEIIRGLEEAIAFERGELHDEVVVHSVVTARDVVIAPAPFLAAQEIARLREQLRLSQPVFASLLNVSHETVKGWEQGKRSPDGAARRLLEVAATHPELILEKIRPLPEPRGGRSTAKYPTTRRPRAV